MLMAVGLIGCGGTTYDYYNPLDPATAATVEDVLAAAPMDPALAQAISDFWAGTMKNEVNYVGAANYGVSSVEGIEFFPEIWELDLSQNPSLAGVDLSNLARLPRLTSLVLNEVIDPNIESLSGISATSVQLAENNIIYPDLEILADLGVRDVALTGPSPPSSSFYTVQGATVFEDVRDSGLAATLQDRIGLEYFSFVVATDFSGMEALVGTNNIELGFNEITDPGLLQPFFANSATAGIQSDHDLSLYGNPLDPGLLDGLGPYLQQLESLNLGGLAPNPNGPVTSITTGNTGVSETIIRLSVAENPDLTDIEIINGLPNLEELIVSNSGVDDLDLFSSDLPRLRVLEANNLSGGGSLFTTVTGISVYQALEVVELQDNADLTSGVAELAGLPNLREVYLSGSLLVPDADIQLIIDQNPDVFVEYPNGTTYTGGT